MGYPLRRAKDHVRKARLQPGEYQSQAVSVEEASGFVAGDAVTITYELEKAGNKWSFRETFMCQLHNPRTAAFVEYLENNGVDSQDLNDFVGCREKVQLLKEDKGERGVFLNIVAREFMGRAE